MGLPSFVFLLSASILVSQVSSRAVEYNVSTVWKLPHANFPQFIRYFKERTTWDDANLICNSFRGELITLETDDRRDTVRAFLKELDILDNVWCGLQRSTIEAPFTWTGGGLGPLEGNGFWQEAYPLEPERLCVALSPVNDFRWLTYPCTGPQLFSFICQLSVPEWAQGPRGCLVGPMPSLSVTYRPNPGVCELLSDCGLSGTKRIACKGGEKQEDLKKKLECDEDVEDNSTQDTSTPAHMTSQMTRSSGTRHKRESGGTSTTTDTSLLQESETLQPETGQELVDHRIPAPERLSPLDTTTVTPDYIKEDQIEETTVSVVDHDRGTSEEDEHSRAQPKGQLRPPTVPAAAAPVLTVNSWLKSYNDHITELLESTENPPETTTLSKVETTTAQVIVAKQEPERTATTAETAETSTGILNTHMKQAIETPPTTFAPKEATTVETAPEGKESHLPHPPLMQLRDHLVKSVQKVTPVKPTTRIEETTTAVIQDDHNEQAAGNTVIITIEDSFLNDTENNIFPQDSEVALNLPEQEALVSEKFQVSSNNKIMNKEGLSGKVSKKGKEDKLANIAGSPETTVAPHIDETEATAKNEEEMETTTTKLSDEDELLKNVPIIVIEELEEAEATERPNETANHAKAGLENLGPEDDETESTVSSVESEDETTSTVQPTKESTTKLQETSTLIPPQGSETVPEPDRPLLDKSTITSEKQFENVTEAEEKMNSKDANAKKGEVEVTAASLTNEPKDTVTDAPTHTHAEVDTTASPSSTHITLNQATGAEVTNTETEFKPAGFIEVETSEIHSDTSLINKAADETPSSVHKEMNNTPGDEGTTQDLPMSEESSEEAENPKRTSRGRLFQHSNPLSFYPYFLNRVLG